MPDTFAKYFRSKVDDIVKESVINNSVYNGKRKVNSTCENFMTFENVEKCMLTLKTKNTEAFDRIPQRILRDGVAHLALPFTTLMNKIYSEKAIPAQWKISKIIPGHKKVIIQKLKTTPQSQIFALAAKYLKN